MRRTVLRPARRAQIEAWMIVKDPTKLRRARRDSGYTQVELARLVDVKQQYISALETGVDKDCSDRVAERICRYLDLRVEDYFNEHRSRRAPSTTTRSRVTSDAA